LFEDESSPASRALKAVDVVARGHNNVVEARVLGPLRAPEETSISLEKHEVETQVRNRRLAEKCRSILQRVRAECAGGDQAEAGGCSVSPVEREQRLQACVDFRQMLLRGFSEVVTMSDGKQDRVIF
jgi:hypothetical protein